MSLEHQRKNVIAAERKEVIVFPGTSEKECDISRKKGGDRSPWNIRVGDSRVSTWSQKQTCSVAVCSVRCTGRHTMFSNQVIFKKELEVCSNTYVNGRADEIGQFLHPAHKAASHLAQVASHISVFLLLPNCIDDWLGLYTLMDS